MDPNESSSFISPCLQDTSGPPMRCAKRFSVINAYVGNVRRRFVLLRLSQRSAAKLIARTYLEVLRHTPVLWDFMYDNPDVETATREIRDLLNLISRPKMKTLLKRHNGPDGARLHSGRALLGFCLRKAPRGKFDIPLIAVITDFAVHSYWVYNGSRFVLRRLRRSPQISHPSGNFRFQNRRDRHSHQPHFSAACSQRADAR